jgi:uncharacterized protein (DUF58 family)
MKRWTLNRRTRPTPTGAGATRSHFFNRVWLGAAAVALVIGAVAGNPALTLLSLLVLVTAGGGWLWNRSALNDISYERTLSADRALPGDIVTVTISVTNRKLLPIPWLIIDDELPDDLRPIARATMPSGTVGRQVMRLTTYVRSFERVSWTIEMECLARGIQRVGPVTLRSSDPFGFFSSKRTEQIMDEVIVYPRSVPLPDLGFPHFQPLGDTRAPRHLLTDPLRTIGIRDYRPEDSFKSIHWKATARQGSLHVRVNEPITTLTVAVFANLDTFTHYWEGLDINAAERVIEITASIARWSLERSFATGVFANGVVAGSDQPLRLLPGLSDAQLPRIMTGLARVSPYSTVSFAAFLRAEAGRLPGGSTVAVVSAHLDDALTAQLAALIAAGRTTVFIPVGECEAPSLRGLIVRPVPDAIGQSETTPVEEAA